MLQMTNKGLVALDTPKKIRVKFSKAGELVYISHLDLVRTMTRAIKRAKIPVKYTEGYNPIPKLIFATPLSVGCSSVCEFLDFKITSDMPLCVIKENLALAFPEGMEVLSVYEPSSKFTEAVYSKYEIEILDSKITQSSLDAVLACFDAKELVITKRSKSGEKEVDILPYVKRLDCTSQDGRLKIDCVLSSSSADYLNPEYIVSIAYNALGVSKDNYSPDAGYSILRKNLCLADGVTEFK